MIGLPVGPDEVPHGGLAPAPHPAALNTEVIPENDDRDDDDGDDELDLPACPPALCVVLGLQELQDADQGVQLLHREDLQQGAVSEGPLAGLVRLQPGHGLGGVEEKAAVVREAEPAVRTVALDCFRGSTVEEESEGEAVGPHCEMSGVYWDTDTQTLI